MKRGYRLFIDDIRGCIKLIESYTKGISEEDFQKDKILQDALIRRIEIIGEASKNIPLFIKKINPQIPWKNIEDYRNFIAHSYFEASINRIWQIVKKDIPKLKENIKKIKVL